MSYWKRLFKSWASVPVLILIALVVVWFFVTVAPRITFAFKAWQAQRAYDKMWEPYYKDTYGGKTPEETYDLFIEALKKGDVELASKYFVVNRQEEWKETINQYRSANVLSEFVDELETNRKLWKPGDRDDEKTAFLYPYTRNEPLVTELPVVGGKTQKVTLPAGTFNAEIIFNKYPSGVWKIAVL